MKTNNKKVYMAKDEFDELRIRCLTYLTGGDDYDAENNNILLALNKLDANVSLYWNGMAKDPQSYLWPEYKVNSNYHQSLNCFQRLVTMALAYCQYGSGYYQDINLRDDIIKGLDRMYDNRFSDKIINDPEDDWWVKEIGCSLQLCYILIMMYDDLAKEQINKWVKTLDHYNPRGYDYGANWGATTASNRSDKCSVIMMRAIIGKNEEMMDYVKFGIDENIAYAGGIINRPGNRLHNTLEDGYYRDGSFMMHEGYSYNTGYGTAMLENLPLQIYTLHGTRWAYSAEKTGIVCNWVYNAYIPIIFKGGVMDMTKGREIARPHLQSHMMGHRVASAICGLVDAVPEEDSKKIKEIVKGWVIYDTYLDFFSYAHAENQRQDFAGATIRMERLAGDSSIIPITDFNMAKMYTVMDRAVVFRPGYAYGLAMNSSRVLPYEDLRGENRRGWYTGEGTLYYYTDNDLGHYDGDYWATIDLHRLPGTTVDTRRRADDEGNKAGKYSDQDWVGGAGLDGKYLAVGMSLHAWKVTLTAKKSWFMLDGKVVALGAGISSTDGRNIETIVENRKLKTDGSNTLTVNGEVMPSVNGWYGALENVKWIHLENSGGYYFPSNPRLHALRENRSGSWKDLGGNGTDWGNNYFAAFWFDHGANPENKSYEYVLLPNMTAKETREYAQNPDIVISENSTKAQAVRDTSAGITGINFWAETDGGYTVSGVTCDKKAAFIMIEGVQGMRISVSDPTWKNDGEIRFEVNKAVGKLISKDDEITVIQTSPTLIFTVRTESAATQGRSFSVSFSELVQLR